MSLKTLHVTNAWHAHSGGIRTYYQALLQAANEHGRQVRLVVPADEDRVEEIGRWGRIYHVRAPAAPFNPRYRILYPSQFLLPPAPVRTIVCDERPDLVELCDKYTLPYLGGLLRMGWLKGAGFRPVVVGLSCERMDENVAAYLTAGAAGRLFARLYMKWIYFPQFDHHLTVSGHAAAELREAARGHQVERGVWNCPMGVDDELFSPARRRTEVRNELVASTGATVLLLYAGRLDREKNLPLLIDMLERLPDPRVHLLIAGDGHQREALESDAAHRAPGRVHFLGYVRERHRLADLLANCDAFVHPNPREPFGIAPLEAMASELPLVAPRSGGLIVYANDGNAWLSEPAGPAFAASVHSILADADQRTRRVAAALETARRHSWRSAMTQALRIYDEIHARHCDSQTSGPIEPLFYSTAGNRFGVEPGALRRWFARTRTE
ncbi:MAG: glycosyltransferase [Bryobacterales bacterium]|nr:glycosyltransferase [Bryobacterales bacterium]